VACVVPLEEEDGDVTLVVCAASKNDTKLGAGQNHDFIVKEMHEMYQLGGCPTAIASPSVFL